MLSPSGLGLSFVSLWFCSETQGRPYGEEDSHCSNQDSGVPQLAQTWPLCQCLMRFLCVLGCCVDEAGWCLALPLQTTLAPFRCPCCVFWGTQHDYIQTTDHDKAPGCRVTLLPAPHRPGTLWHNKAEWVPPHQSFLAPALQPCVAKARAGLHSPSR